MFSSLLIRWWSKLEATQAALRKNIMKENYIEFKTWWGWALHLFVMCLGSNIVLEIINHFWH